MKKIVITHDGEENLVSEYLEEKCPDLYREGIFTLQKESGSLKLAGKVAIIKSEQVSKYASSSCVASDGDENFILTVKHLVDEKKGTSKHVPIMYLITETRSNECPGMLGYYGARNGHFIDVLLIQLPFSVSPLTQISVVPVPEASDTHVRKYGVSTGYTDGFIVDRSYSHRVNNDIGICHDFFLVAGNQRGGYDKFADQGDSGALVKLQSDPTQAIGMVFAVQDNFRLDDECVVPHVTVCIPLDVQLEQIKEIWGKNLSLYEGDIRSTLYVL